MNGTTTKGRAIIPIMVTSCTACPHCQASFSGSFCGPLGIYVKEAVDTHTIHIMCPYLEPKK